MRLSFLRSITFMIIACCLTPFYYPTAHGEENWVEYVVQACKKADMKCLAACERVQKAGQLKSLILDPYYTCKAVMDNLETKPLVGKACGATSCIVRLKLHAVDTVKDIFRYAGQGYSVILTYSVPEDGPVHDEISASISSPSGTITKLYKECGGDGWCPDDWTHKSGPLTNANIKILAYRSPTTDIVLQIPRSRAK